jgi:hypothetical protein
VRVLTCGNGMIPSSYFSNQGTGLAEQVKVIDVMSCSIRSKMSASVSCCQGGRSSQSAT